MRRKQAFEAFSGVLPGREQAEVTRPNGYARPTLSRAVRAHWDSAHAERGSIQLSRIWRGSGEGKSIARRDARSQRNDAKWPGLPGLRSSREAGLGLLQAGGAGDDGGYFGQ